MWVRVCGLGLTACVCVWVGGGLLDHTYVCLLVVCHQPLSPCLSPNLNPCAPSPPTHTQYLTRQGLASAGLPTPKNSRISKPDDIEPAGQHVGFPSVIKPVSGGCGFVWGRVMVRVCVCVLGGVMLGG